MKKYKKYQVGTDVPDVRRPQARMQQFSGDTGTKDILAFMLSPEGEELVKRWKKAGYKPIANDKSLSFERDTGYRDFNPAFKAFNTGALLATGIATGVNEAKNRKNEFQQYERSIVEHPWENFDEQGLNPLPIYTQYGGGYEKMKSGGKWIPKNLKKGRCTPLGNPDCPPGSPQYNLAKTFKKHHGFHKSQTGGMTLEQQQDFATRFADQRGQINPILDKTIPFVDESGRPISSVKRMAPKLSTTVPSDITLKDIYQTREGVYMYDDPHTGDATPVHPSVLNMPRFRKSQEGFAMGGHTRREPYCMEYGGYMETGGPNVGDEMDLTPEQIEHLIGQGYEVEQIQPVKAMHGIDTQGNSFTILM